MRKYQRVQAVLLCAALTAAPAAVYAEETNDGPERIVSMGPNMTEILYALGAGDRLAGRTDYCDYPSQVREVESVGSIYEPDMEKILSLEPDLVLASTHFSEDAIKQLEDAGVQVLYLYDEGNLEGVYSIIEAVGEAVNCEDAAEQVVAEMKAKLDYAAEHLAQAEENPSVYYVVGYGEYGDYTAGGDTFINGILTAAGGENVAADTEGWSYSVETLLEKDPYYIITNQYDAETFCETDPYTELTAVQEGRVYTIDTNMLDRQGPRNADAVVELAQLFHPEVFPEAAEYPIEISVSDGDVMTVESCPESVYAADEELQTLLEKLGAAEKGSYTEKTVDEIIEEMPQLVLAKDPFSEEDEAALAEAGIMVLYLDPEEEDTVTLLGQILDRNTAADELIYVEAALAE